LGGHSGGEKASRFFCQGLLKQADAYSKLMLKVPVEAMSFWINAAIQEMKELFAGNQEGNEAHTTCAILYLNARLALTAHCGDSRIYRMDPEQVLWRTRDHSIPQRLLDEGVITEPEMAQHPMQNQLLRSINLLNKAQPEINVYPAFKRGETFILCTDGFWAYVKNQELLQLAQPDSGKAELCKMAQMAMLRAKGNSDNVTAQWIRFP
jgi:PPM family protein phosphatase